MILGTQHQNQPHSKKHNNKNNNKSQAYTTDSLVV